MIRWHRLLLLVFFFIDIQVKADDGKSAPEEDCWGKKIPCAILSNGHTKLLEAEGVRLVLAPGSLVEQRTADSLQLVAGSLYAEVTKPLKISTPYGRFWCEADCRGLFDRRKDFVKAKSLGGQWSIQRLGENDSIYGLKSGMQFWISEVGVDGKAAMEFPQSLPWLSTVKEWAKLYPGKPDEFKQALVKFRVEWREAVETASQISFRSAERLIASHNKQMAEIQARKQAQEREDEGLRRRFRENNYVEF